MDTRSVLIEFIANELVTDPGAPPLEDDDKLVETGLIDSLGMLRLVSFLKSSFGVAVPDEDLTISNFASVRAIMGYIERRRASS